MQIFTTSLMIEKMNPWAWQHRQLRPTQTSQLEPCQPPSTLLLNHKSVERPSVGRQSVGRPSVVSLDGVEAGGPPPPPSPTTQPPSQKLRPGVAFFPKKRPRSILNTDGPAPPPSIIFWLPDMDANIPRYPAIWIPGIQRHHNIFCEERCSFSQTETSV